MHAIERRTHLPALATSAADARRFSRSALAEWGLSALDDTIDLLVTELVSNGVRHARTTLELVLAFNGTCLRVAVSDSDPRPPMPRVRQTLSVGGWGLALIDSLSTNWGTDVEDGTGKSVWFEIDTTDLPPLST